MENVKGAFYRAFALTVLVFLGGAGALAVEEKLESDLWACLKSLSSEMACRPYGKDKSLRKCRIREGAEAEGDPGCLQKLKNTSLLCSSSNTPNGDSVNVSCSVLQEKPVVIENPLFWRATREGKTIYLLGTQHVGVSLQSFPREVTDAIGTSAYVLTETGKSELDASFWSQALMLADAVNLWNPLDEALSEKAWKNLQEHVGTPAKYMEPWFVMLLLIDIGADSSGFRLDREIVRYAKTKGISVASLEDPDDVLSAMKEGFSLELLEATLTSTENTEELKKMFREESQKVDDCYMESNQACLLDSETPTQQFEQQLEKVLIDKRNRAWIPVILEYWDKTPQGRDLFVAAGVFHFIYEGSEQSSVISLLKAEGFHVERVDFSRESHLH